MTFPLHPTLNDWRPLLVKHGEGLPIDFLLAWIRHESAGNPCSTGIANVEAGIFQTFHPDDDRFGLTFAQLRASCVVGKQTAARALTDDEADAQVRHGLAYVRAARDVARKQLAGVGADWPESSADFWMLVKLRHALPALGSSYLVAFKTANGHAPRNWNEWRDWVEGLSRDEFCSVSSGACRFHSELARLFNNAEKVGGAAGGLLGGTVSMLMLVLLVAAAWLFAR